LKRCNQRIAIGFALNQRGWLYSARCHSCFQPAVVRKWAGAWETIVTSEQARERCHRTLVAGLRLIQPEERVMAIAAALQEVEAQEKRLYTAVMRQ
jgi:hypothetical protein